MNGLLYRHLRSMRSFTSSLGPNEIRPHSASGWLRVLHEFIAVEINSILLDFLDNFSSPKCLAHNVLSLCLCPRALYMHYRRKGVYRWGYYIYIFFFFLGGGGGGVEWRHKDNCLFQGFRCEFFFSILCFIVSDSSRFSTSSTFTLVVSYVIVTRLSPVGESIGRYHLLSFSPLSNTCLSNHQPIICLGAIIDSNLFFFYLF